MIDTVARRAIAPVTGPGDGSDPPAPHTGRHYARTLLLTDGARPLRFTFTGGTAGLIQLALLALLTGQGWPAAPANAFAFLLAVQVNFGLSSLFTWRDRPALTPLWRRWLAFHGAIAAMTALNGLVFLAAHPVLPTLPAAALGIAIAAGGNFLLGDRLVFRVRDVTGDKPAP